jgi:hypothetical protein
VTAFELGLLGVRHLHGGQVTEAGSVRRGARRRGPALRSGRTRRPAGRRPRRLGVSRWMVMQGSRRSPRCARSAWTRCSRSTAATSGRCTKRLATRGCASSTRATSSRRRSPPRPTPS